MHQKIFFLVLILSLALFSCAKKETLRRAETGHYQGTVTVSALRQSIGFGSVKSLKAPVEVSITEHGENKGGLNGIFAYKAPGKIRINLFGPFGLTMTEIVIAEGLLQLSVPSENILYEWNSPEVSFSDLVNSSFRYELVVEADSYVLVAHKSDGLNSVVAVKYFFDRTYLLNRTICFYQDGSEVIKAEFSDFNGRLPERTRLTLSNGLVLEVALQEPELDADIPERYFRVIEHGDKRIKSFQEIFKDFIPVR